MILLLLDPHKYCQECREEKNELKQKMFGMSESGYSVNVVERIKLPA